MKTIFISHAVKDKQLIDLFVEGLLINVMQLKTSNVFYTSGDGTKIKSGDDWRSEIRKGLLCSDVILLFISPYYKESEMCLCEMGAAWATDKVVIPIIIPPISYKTVGVIHEPNQIEKILDGESLDRLKDLLHKYLQIPYEEVKTDRWSAKKTRFLTEAKSYLEKNKYSDPFTQDKFNEIKKERDELKIAVKDLITESKESQKLIEDLKGSKDRVAVEKVLKSHARNSSVEELKTIISKVQVALNYFAPIIQKIIFKYYTHTDLHIEITGNRSELDQAIARKIIDEELDLNYENKHVDKVFKSLHELSNFFNSDSFDSLAEEFFEETFNCDCDLENLDFWEEVFEAKFAFNE